MAKVNKLKISKEVSLPVDAMTQTMAMIGRKGAGKTYLATMIAEQMLDAKGQVVVIDPVGVWWGLRIHEDGVTKGKEIFVIGGSHGDVPLVPEAGKRIAQLVIEKGISVVIDVSEFRIGERKRFCADFGEEFFQLKKKNRSPVHVFMEEAQLLVPQNIRVEEARMYSAFEQIVRLGRNYGIGSSIITQRPQSVNKEVLSQVECLCVLQITGPHERKALEYWVQEAGVETPRTLIGELPGLGRGEGYVWSPSWLKIFERVTFSKKHTFDASATPKLGQKAQAASLSAVDVKKLKKDLEDVVEQAEKDDPVALRKKILELQTNRPAVDPGAIQKAIDLAVGTERNKLLASFEEERAKYRYALTHASTVLRQIAELTNRKDVLDLVKEGGKTAGIPQKQVLHVPKKIVTEILNTPNPVQDGVQVAGPEQRILNAIAWMNSIGVSEPEKPAVAFVAGYSPTSSGFQNACGSLRSKGMVEYVQKRLVLTGTGRSIAEVPTGIASNEDLHRKILDKLPGPETKILTVLLTLGKGNQFTKEMTADEAGYSVTSSGFQNACGRLRSLGLVEYPDRGLLKASDILFPL